MMNSRPGSNEVIALCALLGVSSSSVYCLVNSYLSTTIMRWNFSALVGLPSVWSSVNGKLCGITLQ